MTKSYADVLQQAAGSKEPLESATARFLQAIRKVTDAWQDEEHERGVGNDKIIVATINGCFHEAMTTALAGTSAGKHRQMLEVLRGMFNADIDAMLADPEFDRIANIASNMQAMKEMKPSDFDA